MNGIEVLLVIRIIQYNNGALFDDVPKAALSMSGAAAGNRPGLWWGCAWGAECCRELCNALARHYPPQRERVASGANPATDSWDAKHVWDTAHGHHKVHSLIGVHDISPDMVVGQAGQDIDKAAATSAVARGWDTADRAILPSLLNTNSWAICQLSTETHTKYVYYEDNGNG